MKEPRHEKEGDADKIIKIISHLHMVFGKLEDEGRLYVSAMITIIATAHCDSGLSYEEFSKEMENWKVDSKKLWDKKNNGREA